MGEPKKKRLCSVDECNNIHVARGYCMDHYRTIYRFNKYGNNYGTFDVEAKRKYAREYMALNAKNPVTHEHITDSVKKRFWAKVDKHSEGCWVWIGAKTAKRPKRKIAPATQGYGVIHINKRPFYAHRLSFLMHNGYLTEGLVIDHKCDNSLCVNPGHIVETTNKENVTRSHKFSGNFGGYYVKSICKYGHNRIPGNSKPCETCYKERLANLRKKV
jgi:hypothetical protein